MTATHFTSMFSQEDLDKTIADGYVSVQTHPTLDLRIFNYCPSAQYERYWTPVTTQCRGLILDADGFIVARPFEKFRNYSEHLEQDDFSFPEGDPIVSEKMDGSLGIIYTYEGRTAVATRGSFASDQALWATDWLHTNMPNFGQPEGVTTLVEILYSTNRIVVDYKGAEGLWLLGATFNATGADIPVEEITYDDQGYWGGPVAPQYPWDMDKAVRAAQSTSFDNDEGVVLCWPRKDAPSFRLKVKNPRYIFLHRVVTGLSTRAVHEALASDTFQDLLANVPDEFHPWVRQVAETLLAEFSAINLQARRDLNGARFFADSLADRAPRDFDYTYSRRDLAEQIKSHARYPGLCFALEDGKDIDQRIWQMVRPERSTAMIIEDDV